MKDLKFLTGIPFAHRGLHDEVVPENSLSSIRKAMNRGYNIEIDVQKTADDKIVVFHDRKCGRLIKGKERIKYLGYKELSGRYLSGSSEKIPLLEEVLEEINGKVSLLIEIKSERLNRAMEEEVYNITRRYKGNYAVMSFNPLSARWFMINAPSVAVGQLITCMKYPGLSVPASTFFYRKTCDRIVKTDFTAYNVHCLPNFAAVKEKKTNKPILTWTVRTEEEKQKALIHADNMIFEKPVDPSPGLSAL